MKPTPLALIPLTLALAAAPANAEVLAEVYRQALANDPQLKAAAATYRADREVVAQNHAALLPDIDLSASTGYQKTETDSESAFSSGDASGNVNGFSLTLTQPLFRAQDWFTFQQGQKLSAQAQSVFAQAQQELILRTVESYLAVLRARTELITAEAEEKAVKRRLDQVSAQFDVGLIAITDVQEAQAAYDNSRVQRILAEGALANSYEGLERLTGNTYTDVAPLAAGYPIEPLKPERHTPWIDKAAKENIALQVTEYGIEAARQASKSAEAGHYPTLDLRASYNDDASQTFDTETRSLTLNLNIPLYSGGFTSSRERAALARLEVAVQSHEDTYRDVVQRTRSLFRDLRTNMATVEARRQSIRSSESALKATEAGFEVGTRNVVDVLDAERQLFQAQRDYANARYDYVINLFRFKQVVGVLSPEDIFELDRWMRHGAAPEPLMEGSSGKPAGAS